MQRSFAWLALIGAALYAVNTWPFADISHRNGEEIPSSPAGPTSPASESKKAECTAAQIDLPTPQPTLTPEPPVANAAIDEKTTAEPVSATSSLGQAERLVVRSTANIRSRPSSKGALIGTAHIGAELEVAERQARWVRFVDPAPSNTGWIYERLLAPPEAVTAGQ
jgi:SH3 domain-containing protein